MKATSAQIRQFHEKGYLVIRRLFGQEDIRRIRDTFEDIHRNGPVPGYFEPVPDREAGGDPLKLYPRILFPHRFNDTARTYMIDARVMTVLEQLLAEQPLAAQSMFYFKPPGARGQALHQDNYYLRVEPGTCIAAWTAVDRADSGNGGLVVVPKTQRLDIRCPREADPALSFFRDEVDVPEGLAIVPVNMEAGDVLFFNGSTIHGSWPNRSGRRFRRSFICHYIGTSSARITDHLHNDLYTASGEIVAIARNDNGGPCGEAFPAASTTPH